MIIEFIKKIFGSRNDRLLKEYLSTLKDINKLGIYYSKLSDDLLRKEFVILKEQGENQNLIMPNVYAIVREVAFRVLSMRHFDVQILGGIALYYGKITEIATGEGKTLVATLPAVYHAILNRTVHIVTVNDYLAKRDANWMFPIYKFLGLSVGIVVSDMPISEKKTAYTSNIVYGTSSEFGFDYLRDNIVIHATDKVQSVLDVVIIDEVDSILIDEARTPLIISVPDKVSTKLYYIFSKLIKDLSKCVENDETGDFVIDEKNKQIYLTEKGFLTLEGLLLKNKLLEQNASLYDVENLEILHIAYASLKAQYFFIKDIDYIVKNNSVLIVDENTGRIMEDRRWGDGIHQAVEAKEMLPIRNDNHILATITYQNYFRLYKKKCGMTGTAVTESVEFENIYGLEVLVVPSNKPCVRKDFSDLIFLNKKSKIDSIIKSIKDLNILGRPILVGTVSIDVSEFISDILKKFNIKHSVLNAKYHERESAIIANAGALFSVTIATNMAGRGTDIVLGGNKLDVNYLSNYKKVVALGGLKIIGVERHDSRRIDNQLRGRSGRQGDPGSSQFYLSLEDNLIRIFIGDNSLAIFKKLSVSENDTISHPLISRSIENAQKKIESYNFDIRKQLLEYDDIMNEQRMVFYSYRNSIIFNNDFDNIMSDIIFDVVDIIFEFSKELDFFNIIKHFESKIPLKLNLNFDDFNSIDRDTFKNMLYKNYLDRYIVLKNKVAEESNWVLFCKMLVLKILDNKWKDHLVHLDLLKSGIHLRGYAQKDPKIEYKNESFLLFSEMLNSIKIEFLVLFFNISHSNLDASINSFFSKWDDNFKVLVYNKSKPDISKQVVKKQGRNELCYCKSGKKYKYCHGKK